MRFVDEVEIEIQSGRGGKGSSSFRREKYVPLGGPDGGDGGRGGNVSFRADTGLQTLLDFRSRSYIRAGDGEGGGKRLQTGATGEDIIVRVPVGTILRDGESGQVLFELTRVDEERIAAPGGKGGLGNTHFKSSTNRAPRTTTPGEPGVRLRLRLELRLMADVGLLGWPNAGKSTLVSTVSAARPRVADYPFTTLAPSLGVVSVGEDETFVIADIPGLIEGAAEGKGLGHQFLRHLMRNRVLLHLVSLSPMEAEPPERRYRALRDELARYDETLVERPEIVVLTQADLVEPEGIEEARAALVAAGASEPRVISAATGQGVQELVHAVWGLLKATP